MSISILSRASISKVERWLAIPTASRIFALRAIPIASQSICSMCGARLLRSRSDKPKAIIAYKHALSLLIYPMIASSGFEANTCFGLCISTQEYDEISRIVLEIAFLRFSYWLADVKNIISRIHVDFYTLANRPGDCFLRL